MASEEDLLQDLTLENRAEAARTQMFTAIPRPWMGDLLGKVA